jgi:hypothetical protein
VATELSLRDERGTPIVFTPEVFIIAGYTGRDRAQVQHHIDELAHEGIAPPPEVPMWYEMPLENLTTAGEIAVRSAQSSGEVEPLIVGIDGALYLGIGSDHTARDVEREDIATSKRVCPKPVGANVVRVDAFGPAFDAVRLESTMDGEPYQSGTFAQIMPLTELIDGLRKRTAAKRFVLSCGTVPLIGGFRYGKAFAARISGGPLAQPIELNYTVTVKP